MLRPSSRVVVLSLCHGELSVLSLGSNNTRRDPLLKQQEEGRKAKHTKGMKIIFHDVDSRGRSISHL